MYSRARSRSAHQHKRIFHLASRSDSFAVDDGLEYSKNLESPELFEQYRLNPTESRLFLRRTGAPRTRRCLYFSTNPSCVFCSAVSSTLGRTPTGREIRTSSCEIFCNWTLGSSPRACFWWRLSLLGLQRRPPTIDATIPRTPIGAIVVPDGRRTHRMPSTVWQSETAETNKIS
jgi:hypothetical protein